MKIRNKVIANKRILVANRGEIATRIFRAATELNLRTIALYSHEDRFSVHRFKADEAYKIGKAGDPLGAYLNWQEIIRLAKDRKVDAIHPGYGFLSENADFAQACAEADIMFCGPSPEVLRLFGDKLAAKEAAKKAGIRRIPGSEEPLPDLAAAKRFAQELGYPVTLKALSGGGGKGIRIVHNVDELSAAFERAQSEAKLSFGNAAIYIEKTIVKPKHIEVQIMGDVSGRIIHLYERDCSIQRRHQKVVELAPALGIRKETREQLLADAVKLARSVNYIGIGTVEFLVDQQGQHYFLEVNPRIQVEHTVTEMVTGIDLVQASIILAAGREMTHPALAIESQNDIQCRGVAMQCRITTEDPKKDFAPDTGKILAYRPAQGFGIRLDEGLGTSGGLVTPYYDSLLVKVTAHAQDSYGVARKMQRALQEFRIRGVKHNIPLLLNIIRHPRFIEGSFDTSFFEEHREVFTFPESKDRATKLLSFIANACVNNPHALPNKTPPPDVRIPDLPRDHQKVPCANNAKSILTQSGVQGLTEWVRNQKQLLLTDTTMRDAQQSLFATRLRNIDIYNASDFYREYCESLFSLEVWGGATFDTALRFLKEDPWERLARVREKIPNILLQMLLRGDNAVGYTNYPEWVIRDFIRLTVEAGLDIFRIFDCLNNTEQMAVAIDEVKKRGAVAEACVCYTGDVSDLTRTKYNLKYFLDIAKKLEKMGADILCIKDMAGLLKPRAATILVQALKNEVGLPIHLHTHDTSGNGVAMLLAAAQAGCDIVDGAISSMSGLTSQPSLNAVVASLQGDARQPAIPMSALDTVAPYWEGVRKLYSVFDPGLTASTTSVYEHEIPGGQYSNLYEQARSLNVSSSEFYDLTRRYKEVNELFGDIVKVTPSSKVVGDMALLLQKNQLSAAQLLERKPKLDYPDSVVSFFKGHMGVPFGGFPPQIRELVLGPNAPAPEKPVVASTDSLQSVKAELAQKVGFQPSERDVLSYRLYPKVFLEYHRHRKQYGAIDQLPTHAFYFGLRPNDEIEVELEPGKTLIISLDGISEPTEKGTRKVFFQLNGFPREIEIDDLSLTSLLKKRTKADPFATHQVAAGMPGKVLDVKVAVGTHVQTGTILFVTESMKMEYAVTAKAAGKVARIEVQPGDMIEEGDLMLTLEP